MDRLSKYIETIELAFRDESGPARSRSPRHCDECREADERLLDLDPIDLTLEDLANEECNWIFAFATDASLRWLLPGMVRVSLAQNPPDPGLFLRIVENRSLELSEEQRRAFVSLLEDCRVNGWMSDELVNFVRRAPWFGTESDLSG